MLASRIGPDRYPIVPVANQLHDLFTSLDSATSSSVRPQRELAYLALVNANGGDHAETGEANEDSNTEMTVVEDPTAQSPADDNQANGNDDAEAVGHQTIENQPAERSDQSNEPTVDGEITANTNSAPKTEASQQIGQPATVLPSTPPLPKRPARRSLSSSLMFGGEKQIPVRAADSDNGTYAGQQDISECLDNVLFQLEAAMPASGLVKS